MYRDYRDAEALILWPPDAKSWLTGKDPDAGQDWRQEEKGTTDDEMLDDITDSMDTNLSKLRERVKDKEVWRAAVQGVTKSQTWLNNNNKRKAHHKGNKSAICKAGRKANSAVATGLEKGSFHSNPKERRCQRMLKLPHNCTHLTR